MPNKLIALTAARLRACGVVAFPTETDARGLYTRLCEMDRFAFDRVLLEAPPDDEDWWAVNDRLARAAHGDFHGVES